MDYRPTTEPGYVSWEQSAANENEREYLGETLLKAAARLEDQGRYAEAIRVYERYIPLTWHNVSSARDRIEVLRQVTDKTDRSLLKLYLRAREFYDNGKLTEAQGLMQRVYADKKAGFLRAHALYALASMEYDWNHFPRAAALYRQLLREFPKTLKREATLMMLARCYLRSPPQREWDEWTDSPLPSPDNVRRGRALLYQLLKEYPRTRFRLNVIGWLGRCEYVQRRYPEAMRLYLKQLNAAKAQDESANAIASVHFTENRMTARDAKQFREMLLAEPELVTPYLDYRLYHSNLKPADTDNLARLMESVVQRHPRLKLPPVILARLAEIDYRRGRYRNSVRWAERALAATGHNNAQVRHDLATYVRGAARQKLRDVRGAIADFETLLRRFPRSYLRAAARENLAILYEKRSNMVAALEHYFVLGYDADIAFLLDARMTTDEIERFIAAHPRHRKRDLLVYSLGIRYLRADDFDRAERALRRLSQRKLKMLSRPKTDEWAGDVGRRLFDPLTSVRDLRRLKENVRKAQTPNAKAEALYALASYYYKKRNLLLYNPSLWNGWRAVHFGCYWNPKHATKQDISAARRHHYEHECVNRARVICLDIVKRYPRSPVAPNALYRAACCARWLADFNSWWRGENKRHDFWTEAIRLMEQVPRRYPKHPLSKSAEKYAVVFRSEKARGW